MTADPEHKNTAWKRTALSSLKILLFIFLVLCWAVYVSRQWEQLSGLNWRMPWGGLAGALLLTLAGYLLRGILWAPLRKTLTGASMSLGKAFQISSIAWMARYIPGKLWSIAGKAYMSTCPDSTLTMNVIAATIDTAILETIGLMMGLAAVLLYPPIAAMLPGNIWLLLLLIPLPFIGLHPRIFVPIVNWLLTRMRRSSLPCTPSYGVLLLIMLGNTLAFLVWSSGAFIAARAAVSLGWDQFPLFVAIFCASWAAGFFVLLAPAGLGVRESVLALGLQQLLHLDPAAVIFITVWSRLLSTLAEFFCYLTAVILPGLLKRIYNPSSAA